MQISENKIFNLWDTNGRRADVLNALRIYAGILEDLNREFPSESWSSYPGSVKQYEFYRRAIAASPEVFANHEAFDRLEGILRPHMPDFYNRTPEFVSGIFAKEKDDFDKNVEQRARHYASNLSRLGFSSGGDMLTTAGKEFLAGRTVRDEAEKMLPLDDTNIILLRQLMKMRIFTMKQKDGTRKYFSPFFLGLWLLLNCKNIDRRRFKDILQKTSPYDDINVNSIYDTESKNTVFSEIDVPPVFCKSEFIEKDVFDKYIKSRRSSAITGKHYFNFYSALYNFYYNRHEDNYKMLLDVMYGEGRTYIQNAFLKNTNLNTGSKRRRFSYDEFVQANKDISWFSEEPFNKIFFKEYCLSKSEELAREYSDTLFRLLASTGVFSFSRAMPELLYADIFAGLMEYADFDRLISGSVSEADFKLYEYSYFGEHNTVCGILSVSSQNISDILKNLAGDYGSSDIKTVLKNRKRLLFEEHIEQKYPKEKVMELLSLFSDRKNDRVIKQFVNPIADVPTIYEYIVALAWYYISGEDYSVYDSLNLTTDSNFEPVIHAGGGAGDIVIYYDDRVVMLEVTLMNKAAQKRGEWEPVLRHSINLKSENEGKETTTIFVADDLDINTINIWRAVAGVPLEASSSKKITDHVYVMPFKSSDLCEFMKRNTDKNDIISAVRNSFNTVSSDFDTDWRNKILNNILSKTL